jgi:alkylation response protein AidB-like acyl-CoA dehydrogenase
VAAVRTAARRDGDDYVISGQKMWITNGASGNLVALLARTPAANEQGDARAHRNLTAFLIEKPSGFGQTRPGLTIPGKIAKMGYKGSTRPSSSSTTAGCPRAGCWASVPARASTR